MDVGLQPVGTWSADGGAPLFDAADIARSVGAIRGPIHVVRHPSGALGVGFGGTVAARDATWPLMATLPALYPEWLGDRSFNEVHQVRFPYVAGEMANGIATARMVIEMARAGMLGFFGAAGLTPARVERAIDEIESALGKGGLSWGSNLIHSPHEPELEEAVADLYLRRGVARVSASAFMDLTPAVVRLAASGLWQDESGRIQRRTHVFAKISRPEVAAPFMSPAPADMLDALVRRGLLTTREAELARHVPVAEDVTVEADSGGHTDNRALTAVMPIVLSLRDALSARHEYPRAIRVGAAGGLGTPSAVAAAFSLGAAYVVTGSVNQSCVEAGLCDAGKRLLAQAQMADVIMAPAADMFEMGVKVQVLRRGTMFGVRAQRLYDLYSAYESLDAIPADVQQKTEREIFRATFDEIWRVTRTFFEANDPREVERAERDPKHKMALVFRWFLGLSSKWAIQGERGRETDYQIWCGPAMGAFNAWAEGSFLADPARRTVVQVAKNLMEGAAVVTRAQQLRSYGVPVPPGAFTFSPRILD